MAELVLFDDMARAAAEERGVSMDDKNPLQRVGGSVKMADGRQVYDFGIEVGEPALSAVSTIVKDSVEFAEAASSVILVVNPDDTCEIRFDTTDCIQVVTWDDVEPDQAQQIHDIFRLADFVDRIPEKNVYSHVPYSGGERHGRQNVADLMRDAGLVGDNESLRGVIHNYMENFGVMSTDIIVTGTRATDLLQRLSEEPTCGGARKLLSDFATGVPASHGPIANKYGVRDEFVEVPYGPSEFEDKVAAIDEDPTFRRIKEALVSGRYADSQALFDAFVDAEANRGDVRVKHTGVRANEDSTFAVDEVRDFLCGDVIDQLDVMGDVYDESQPDARRYRRTQWLGPADFYGTRTSFVDPRYDLNPSVKDVIGEHKVKAMSELDQLMESGSFSPDADFEM